MAASVSNAIDQLLRRIAENDSKTGELRTQEQELKKVTERLEVARKGIILLHDAQARTAAMMPAFLRYLRENGYRVVHIVPSVQTQKNAEMSH